MPTIGDRRRDRGRSPICPGTGTLPRPRPRFVRNRGRSPVPVPDSKFVGDGDAPPSPIPIGGVGALWHSLSESEEPESLGRVINLT
jgi:hypothetical protein